MELHRCLRLVPAVALGAIVATGVLLHPPVAVADDASWRPPDCPAGSPPVPGMTPGPARSAAWFRLEPVLDGTGTLAWQRLVVGDGLGAERRLRLHAEASASGPSGGRVLVTDDDGTRSRLLELDTARWCAVTLGASEDVIRSAVADPDGSALEHRVDRATRADLGVFRRARDGSVARLLAPPAPDPRYGRTFVTELRVEADGRVVVSSCGLQACRVQVRERSGHTWAVGGYGPALGALGRAVVVRGACTGLPCPIAALPLDGGTGRTIVAGAGAASLDGDGTLAWQDARGVVLRARLTPDRLGLGHGSAEAGR